MDGRVAKLKSILQNPIIVLFGSFALLLTSQLYGAVVAGVFASGASGSVQIFVTILTASVVLAVLVAMLMKVLRVDRSAIGLNRPRRKWVLATIIGAVVYLAVASMLIVLASALFSSFNADQVQDVGVGALTGSSQYVYSFLALALLVPLFEEVIFRGVLFKGLRRGLPLWLAIGISSVMFAVAHGQWNVALDTFAFGIVLAYLVERTGSIWPSILLHILKNSVAFMMLFVLS